MNKELLINRESEEELDIIRHDCAHVLAEAVQSLYPGTQVTIGPTIENGFYYDFFREKPFTSDDLIVIEKKMREIVNKGENFKREVWTQKKAIDYFSKKGETYKVELINDIPEAEEITIYKQGGWLDLCRGPHGLSTKDIGEGFKLTKVAGAYWRGDSSKTMLTRIYGTAWRNKKSSKNIWSD
jgi:threonyl-tRNA synthetase